MKQALLIGTRGGLHDVEAAAQALSRVFEQRYALTVMDERRYPTLTQQDLNPWDMVMFMPQGYGAKSCSKTTRALVRYVVWGGCLLSLHCGLITGGAYELDLLHAARFKGHAAFGLMDYRPGPQAGAHTRQIGPVCLEDEPYTFDFDPMKQTNILLEQDYGCTHWPAAWAHTWAKGKVACVAPGHQAKGILTLAPLFGDIGDWFDGLISLGQEEKQP